MVFSVFMVVWGVVQMVGEVGVNVGTSMRGRKKRGGRWGTFNDNGTWQAPTKKKVAPSTTANPD